MDGNRIIAVISTLLAAFLAVYTHQVTTPSVDLQPEVDKLSSCEDTDDNAFSTCSARDNFEEETMGDPSAEVSSIYDLKYTSIDGTEELMEKYRGHVLLVVNVASKCGYTCVNYEQLTELYTKYAESEGLRILAFPCNQFMGQEPLGEKEIKEFAATYNVQYDMSSKVDVNGDNTHPVWKFLKKQQGGFMGDFIKWNFTKFLVDKNGNVVKRYAPTTNPKDLEKDLLTYFKEGS
ncbi:Phospholipid hydroperoxide glutathione peroxidase, mitochondrial [Orchesella cincta]|uniref:Glutathione peroxidase n=1 Tax=Orchesella cincta TaxID=48709 RepID=A0A1D2NK43_ORCCI|nr:Phospholipid hydroperoxide glutathione peroxidase, mitochondrial [Orchesella cincta]